MPKLPMHSSRENRYVSFQISNGEDFDRIMQEGLWLVDGRLLVIRKWSSDSSGEGSFVNHACMGEDSQPALEVLVKAHS